MKRTIAVIVSALGIFAAAAAEPAPEAAVENAAEEAKGGEIIIDILADGSIRVEGRIIDLEELAQRLTAIAKPFGDQPVRIRGDGGVPYRRVVEVIDTCRNAAISHISFSALPPATPE